MYKRVSGEVHFQQIFMLGRTYHRTYQGILYKKLFLIFFLIYRKHLCWSLLFNKVIDPKVFPYIFSLIFSLTWYRTVASFFPLRGQIMSLRLPDTSKLNLKQKHYTRRVSHNKLSWISGNSDHNLLYLFLTIKIFHQYASQG